jgi:hypothetical protein
LLIIVIVAECNILQPTFFRPNQRHSKSSEYGKDVLAQLGTIYFQVFSSVLSYTQKLATWIGCTEVVFEETRVVFFPAPAGHPVKAEQKLKTVEIQSVQTTKR